MDKTPLGCLTGCLLCVASALVVVLVFLSFFWPEVESILESWFRAITA